MSRRRTPGVVRLALALAALAGVALAMAGYVWREEILRTALDPKQPFQTYRPPPAPDYRDPRAWAIRPAGSSATGQLPVDVFFVHSTTYNGGREWNAPIGEPGADRFLFRVVVPNYVGPFEQVGRVFAPRYRQASLYTALTLRDDAREARRFAYGDVRAAFLSYLAHDNDGRPFILAGVGQGAKLLARLTQEVVTPDPVLRRRLVAVYLMDSVTPADAFAPGTAVPACVRREEAGCVVGWSKVWAGDANEARRVLDRALVWTPDGRLRNLGDRRPLCVNPLTGGVADALASARQNLGAANATGMEWGVRPGFLAHQVSAQCRDGLLWVSRPDSPSLQRSGSWADRRKAAPFNLFYADIEADAEARAEALLGRRLYGPAAPPIGPANAVGVAPVHRID